MTRKKIKHKMMIMVILDAKDTEDAEAEIRSNLDYDAIEYQIEVRDLTPAEAKKYERNLRN